MVIVERTAVQCLEQPLHMVTCKTEAFCNKQRSIKITKKHTKTYTYLFLQVISYGSKKKKLENS